MATTIKILGTDDSVNACDCCGKSDLKSTVIVEVNGEILHYGSTCATRHTGLSAPEIKRAIKSHSDSIKEQAAKRYAATPEHLAETAAIMRARRANLKPGTEFGNYVKPFALAAQAVKAAIAVEFRLKVWEF